MLTSDFGLSKEARDSTRVISFVSWLLWKQFLTCRNGSLENIGSNDDNLVQMVDKANDLFPKRIIMTPRLLHDVLEYL